MQRATSRLLGRRLPTTPSRLKSWRDEIVIPPAQSRRKRHWFSLLVFGVLVSVQYRLSMTAFSIDVMSSERLFDTGPIDVIHKSPNAAVTVTRGLPSAKSLLTAPPPFDDSQIIKLSEFLITSPNTVVTAYYRIPSKFEASKYTRWMKNMLSLQDAMVIFTSRDLVPTMQQLRSHALNRTVIIPLELNDLPIGTLYSKEFWQDQLERNPEKTTHKSYELFWIWLSKSWWVSQAIRLNIYQSDLFVWSDMGCFRHRQYNNKEMVKHRDQVPPHEMIQMAHHRPNPPPTQFFNDKLGHRRSFYHSGSQMAGYVDTWKVFHENFLDTINGFLERNMIIVDDQSVLQSVCLRYPDTCAYLPFDQLTNLDNHYFGLRYALHYGGNFTLWRYDNTTVESKSQ